MEYMAGTREIKNALCIRNETVMAVKTAAVVISRRPQY
jgi:hypothetical protein